MLVIISLIADVDQKELSRLELKNRYKSEV